MNNNVSMTFIKPDGEKILISVPTGSTILEAARKANLDDLIEGACDGCLACSTCHVIIDDEWFSKLPTASEDEEDMLDLAFGVEANSRLGCQIKLDAEKDGIIVKIPAASRNVKQ